MKINRTSLMLITVTILLILFAYVASHGVANDGFVAIDTPVGSVKARLRQYKPQLFIERGRIVNMDMQPEWAQALFYSDIRNAKSYQEWRNWVTDDYLRTISIDESKFLQLKKASRQPSEYLPGDKRTCLYELNLIQNNRHISILAFVYDRHTQEHITDERYMAFGIFEKIEGNWRHQDLEAVPKNVRDWPFSHEQQILDIIRQRQAVYDSSGILRAVNPS